MQRLVFPALVALFLASATRAQAIVAQLSGLPNPDRVIDFGANLFPNFSPVSTEFPGIVLTHASYFTTGVSANLQGGFLTNNFSAGLPNTLRIQFADAITDVSFVYHQVGTGLATNMRALLQGTTVDSFSGIWSQFQPNNYFGFTNILFDEVQIDFVGDFNVDTIAFRGPTVAKCFVVNGNNVNPLGLSCLNAPVIGTTWEALVASTPNTAATFIAYAPGGFGSPFPLFGGELLVSLAPAPALFSTAGPFAVAIPPSPIWVGTNLTFQGMRIDVIGGSPSIVLLNAVGAFLGN